MKNVILKGNNSVHIIATLPISYGYTKSCAFTF